MQNFIKFTVKKLPNYKVPQEVLYIVKITWILIVRARGQSMRNVTQFVKHRIVEIKSIYKSIIITSMGMIDLWQKQNPNNVIIRS